QPFQAVLRVLQLGRAHLVGAAGDVAGVGKQVVQHLPQRPVAAPLGGRGLMRSGSRRRARPPAGTPPPPPAPRPASPARRGNSPPAATPDNSPTARERP